MKVLLATNNEGKALRFKGLLQNAHTNIELYTPRDLGIAVIYVEENGATLQENALLKARAYVGKVDMPILSNDTGFFVAGEGFIDAPKRKALGETKEHLLTKEEIASRLLSFWKGIATKHGGRVDVAWVEAFVAVYPNGDVRKADARREAILTDQEFGVGHLQMPVRALYISKTTGKPAIQHTEKEEMLEMQPVIAALKKILY